MKILIWHGYFLGGAGSNVYSRALAREWSLSGHDVTLFCQEPNPDHFDLGTTRVIKPKLPNDLLPVFVLDDYPGLEAKLLQDFSYQELLDYVSANVEAMREFLPADLVFTNHALMGGPVGLASGSPFRVKIHGSELEYSVRGRPELIEMARYSLDQAETVYVGSKHIRDVLAKVVGHTERVVEVPPGVNINDFVIKDRKEALRELLEEVKNDPPNPGNGDERLPDKGNYQKFDNFFSVDKPTVIYFGKLIKNKGVQLLLEALESLDARAIIVGFGDYRNELEKIAKKLPDGKVLFTGVLEHRHLVHLLPLADAAVVPSIFPEAFGMVAAEAAASGCPPLVANHSGLAEIAAELQAAYPKQLRHLTVFEPGDSEDMGKKLGELLSLSAKNREAIKYAGRSIVETHWSWTVIAKRLLQK
jgi:glycosyltransferase involved in cell wall biosynthesis